MSHYDSYAAFKRYSTPSLGNKHIRRIDREVWGPAGFATDHAVLEIGCGTGLFLAYLGAKGVSRFLGIDLDPDLAGIVPEAVREHFQAADAMVFVKDARARGERYDRIALFDVIEHFDPEEGRILLSGLAEILTADGRVVVKVPNAASPWGQQFQYGDLDPQDGLYARKSGAAGDFSRFQMSGHVAAPARKSGAAGLGGRAAWPSRSRSDLATQYLAGQFLRPDGAGGRPSVKVLPRAGHS